MNTQTNKKPQSSGGFNPLVLKAPDGSPLIFPDFTQWVIPAPYIQQIQS